MKEITHFFPFLLKTHIAYIILTKKGDEKRKINWFKSSFHFTSDFQSYIFKNGVQKAEKLAQEKQLNAFIEYQKSVKGLDDSEDELDGRSVTQEVDYQNKK